MSRPPWFAASNLLSEGLLGVQGEPPPGAPRVGAAGGSFYCGYALVLLAKINLAVIGGQGVLGGVGWEQDVGFDDFGGEK